MAHTLVRQEEHPDEHDSRLLDNGAVSGRGQLDSEGATGVEGASAKDEHDREEKDEFVRAHLLIRLLEVIDVSIDALFFAEGAAEELARHSNQNRENDAEDAFPAHHVAGFLADCARPLQDILLCDTLTGMEELSKDHAEEAK